MVTVPWQPPAEPTSYSAFGDDGRSFQVVLLPDSRAIIWYAEDKTNFMEGNLVRLSGYRGTHYFWRLWNVDSNDGAFGPSLLGLRYFEAGTPFILETEVLAHFIGGNQKPSLPNKGERVKQLNVLISDDTIRFQDMWLEKDETAPSELEGDIDIMVDLLVGAQLRKSPLPT